MPRAWKPDLTQYSKVKDFSKRENAYNYIVVGWELIEVRRELPPDMAATTIYRMGWLSALGKPVEPPELDEATP